ncbi:MAG: sulfurtransferase FdhD, partial [Pseudomonas alloputida]
MNSKPPVCAASSPLSMPAASNTYDYVQLSDAKRDSTPLAEEVALAIVYNGLNQAVM